MSLKKHQNFHLIFCDDFFNFAFKFIFHFKNLLFIFRFTYGILERYNNGIYERNIIFQISIIPI